MASQLEDTSQHAKRSAARGRPVHDAGVSHHPHRCRHPCAPMRGSRWHVSAPCTQMTTASTSVLFERTPNNGLAPSCAPTRRKFTKLRSPTLARCASSPCFARKCDAVASASNNFRSHSIPLLTWPNHVVDCRVNRSPRVKIRHRRQAHVGCDEHRPESVAITKILAETSKSTHFCRTIRKVWAVFSGTRHIGRCTSSEGDCHGWMLTPVRMYPELWGNYSCVLGQTCLGSRPSGRPPPAATELPTAMRISRNDELHSPPCPMRLGFLGDMRRRLRPHRPMKVTIAPTWSIPH